MKSAAWSDDIHIYDSGSTDDTVAIAEKFGAKITQRTYADSKLIFRGDEAQHRNWGLKNISFKHPWVFVIDADERMTPNLVRAANEAVASAGGAVAFRVQRRVFFMGTWLKHVQTSPLYIRLFRPEKMHYERLVNPVSIATGPVKQVEGYLDHFPFSKGMNRWLERHNSFSWFEAQQIIKNHQHGKSFSWIKAFTEKDFHQRRYHQKELFNRLPFRPVVKFLVLYVAKRGFLDGRAGFTYAVLQMVYEYFIVLKVREIEFSELNNPHKSPRPATSA